MGRRLPWEIDPKPSTASLLRPSVSRPPKRIKTEPQNATPSSPTRSRNGPRARSPSTSPPPPAPAPVEKMRPGFDEDDLYMMVEDTFNATANIFTAHLHRAEYKRLKRLAEYRKAAGPTLPSNPRAQLAHRQEQAIRTELNVQRPLEDDKDAVDDLQDVVFTGASFARLMKNDRQRTSLKGLDRLPSDTRAAQGYADRQEERRKKNIEKEYSSKVLRIPQPALVKQEPRVQPTIEVEDEMSQHSTRLSEPPKQKALRPQTVNSELVGSRFISCTKTSQVSSKPKKAFAFDDGFDSGSNQDALPSVRVVSHQRQKKDPRSSTKLDKTGSPRPTKSTKGGADEVPMFLC